MTGSHVVRSAQTPAESTGVPTGSATAIWKPDSTSQVCHQILAPTIARSRPWKADLPSALLGDLPESRHQLAEEILSGDESVNPARSRDRDDQDAVVEEELGELGV